MVKFKLTQQKYNEKIATIIMETVHIHPEMNFIDVLKWLNIIDINVNACSSEKIFDNMKNGLI